LKLFGWRIVVWFGLFDTYSILNFTWLGFMWVFILIVGFEVKIFRQLLGLVLEYYHQIVVLHG
jgi:hypothetical protein